MRILNSKLLLLLSSFTTSTVLAQTSINNALKEKSIVLDNKHYLNTAFQASNQLELVAGNQPIFKIGSKTAQFDMKIGVVNSKGEFKWAEQLEKHDAIYENVNIKYDLGDKLIGNGKLNVSTQYGITKNWVGLTVNSSLISRNTSFLLVIKPNHLSDAVTFEKQVMADKNMIVFKNVKNEEIGRFYLPKAANITFRPAVAFEKPLITDSLLMNATQGTIVISIPFAFNPEMNIIYSETSSLNLLQDKRVAQAKAEIDEIHKTLSNQFNFQTPNEGFNVIAKELTIRTYQYLQQINDVNHQDQYFISFLNKKFNNNREQNINDSKPASLFQPYNIDFLQNVLRKNGITKSFDNTNTTSKYGPIVSNDSIMLQSEPYFVDQLNLHKELLINQYWNDSLLFFNRTFDSKTNAFSNTDLDNIIPSQQIGDVFQRYVQLKYLIDNQYEYIDSSNISTKNLADWTLLLDEAAQLQQPKLLAAVMQQFSEKGLQRNIDLFNLDEKKDGIAWEQLFKFQYFIHNSLFGLQHTNGDTLVFAPTFPANWNQAQYSNGLASVNFKKEGNVSHYEVAYKNAPKAAFKVTLPASFAEIKSFKINGKAVDAKWKTGINQPSIECVIENSKSNKYTIDIEWGTTNWNQQKDTLVLAENQQLDVQFDFPVTSLKLLNKNEKLKLNDSRIVGTIDNGNHNHIFYLETNTNQYKYWIPYNYSVNKANEILDGHNIKVTKFDKINLYPYFNYKIGDLIQILKSNKLSDNIRITDNPVLPKSINDVGLRKIAYPANNITLENGIDFRSPTDREAKNVIYLSKTFGLKDQLNLSIDGIAKSIAVMYTGWSNTWKKNTDLVTTKVIYTDNSESNYALNDKNAWIQIDSLNKHINNNIQILNLTTGAVVNSKDSVQQSEGQYAGVAYLPINPLKRVKRIQFKVNNNDVVFGLIGATLIRDYTNNNETIVAKKEQSILYLSGLDSENPKNWEFIVNKGMRSNYWSAANVPGNWELDEFGTYQFGNQLSNSDKIEGTYRLLFEVPANFKDKQIQLRFDGIQGIATIKLNNEVVLKDINQPFEPIKIDVTNQVKIGDNQLTVTITKDPKLGISNHWNLGGIVGSVAMEALPSQYIHQTYVGTDDKGKLKIKTQLKNITANNYLETIVRTEDGRILNKVSKALTAGQTLMEQELDNKQFITWNAERPVQYIVAQTLKLDNKVVHQSNQKIGFTSSDLSLDKGLMVNGQNIFVKGVNYIPFNSKKGYAISEEDLLADLKLIKQMNFNAIRVLDVMPSERLLQICDSMGIYVISSVQMINNQLNDNALNRVGSHPSVIGFYIDKQVENPFKLMSQIKKVDAGNHFVLAADTNLNGIESTEYLSFNQIKQAAFDKIQLLPTAVLNSKGDGGAAASLQQLMDLRFQQNNFNGFFINMFADEGIIRSDQEYRLDDMGGQLSNGIVGSQRELDGSYWAIRDILSPVQIKTLEKTDSFWNFIVANQYNFINLNQGQFSWEYQKFPNRDSVSTEPEIVKKDFIRLDRRIPNETDTITLKLPNDSLDYDAVVFRMYNQFGEEINKWSYALKSNDKIISNDQNAFSTIGTPTISTIGNETELSVGNLKVYIDQKTGQISKVIKNNQPLYITKSPQILQNSGLMNGDGIFDFNNIKNSRTDTSVGLDFENGNEYIKWSLQSNGWLVLDYNSSRAFDGLNFNIPEQSILSVKWRGYGEDKIWENRTVGQTYSIWEQYFGKQSGLQFNGTERYKGFFGPFDWVQCNTINGKITMLVDTPMYLGMYPTCAIKNSECCTGLNTIKFGLMHKIKPAPYQKPFELFNCVEEYDAPTNVETPKSGRIYLYFGE